MKTFDNPELKPTGYLVFGKNQRRALKTIAFEFFWQFAKQVEKTTGRKYFKAVSEIDQMRLLTWKGWMVKYKVSLEFLVKMLVPFWQKRFANKIKRGKFGIGVGIPTLTGQMSEQILQEILKKEFPDQENITAWKSSQRQIRLQKPVKNVSGEDFVEKYLRVMKIRQSKTDTAYASGRYTRRKYRGNPWL